MLALGVLVRPLEVRGVVLRKRSLACGTFERERAGIPIDDHFCQIPVAPDISVIFRLQGTASSSSRT
jgi:hypothetical protein